MIVLKRFWTWLSEPPSPPEPTMRERLASEMQGSKVTINSRELTDDERDEVIKALLQDDGPSIGLVMPVGGTVGPGIKF